MAKVFIGIPTLNRPQLVVETINSVRCQTFGDYRVIVSDNNSDGDAADLVEHYVAGLGDPRFTFYRQPENGGEYGQGRFFFTASGADEYFVILHDDDLLNPEYLETAIRALDDHPTAALFVANPYAMDLAGVRSPQRTARQLRDHGRNGARGGLFDVLQMHMMHDFTAISGTVFRKQALVASGFVDDDVQGNYPFECNVFVRLGEIGAKGWFAPQELLGVRYHEQSLRVYSWRMDNADAVRTMLSLFARRRYSGALERRRRRVISRLYRADALIRLRQGDLPGCRASLRRALGESLRSPKAWGLAPLVWLAPGMLRALMPQMTATRNAPLYSPRHRLRLGSQDSEAAP